VASSKANVHWHIQQQLEVRLDPTGGELLDAGKPLESKPPPPALIGIGRIDKPVAEDDLTTLSGGQDDFPDVLRPSRRHEQRLGLRENSIIVCAKKNRADLLPYPRPSGLPGHQDMMPRGTQGFRQPIGLERLPTALRSLEGDEWSSHLLDAPAINFDVTEWIAAAAPG